MRSPPHRDRCTVRPHGPPRRLLADRLAGLAARGRRAARAARASSTRTAAATSTPAAARWSCRSATAIRGSSRSCSGRSPSSRSPIASRSATGRCWSSPRSCAAISPLADTWCFFNSSGSESVESAIQLALRYWQLRGKPAKTDLISRWPSFHGSTLGALSLSGSQVARRSTSRCSPSTRSRPCRTPTSAGAARRRKRRPGRSRELEDALARRGAQHRRGRRDRARHRRLGRRDRAARRATSPSCAASATAMSVLLVFDETITAFGRTGRVVRRVPLARRDARHHHVREGRDERHRAVLGRARERCGRRAVRAVARRASPTATRSLGYPLGCAVAAEAIRVIRDEDLVAESRRKGALLRARLDAARGGVSARRRRARPRTAAGLELVARPRDRSPRCPAPRRGSSPRAASAG